ncbi:MAG: transglutaminase domain-containing protein [Candidatus Faecousia sp.]|nr:hypothetical protein [Clostridiales bacterium]MDY6180630.1 transglutaminase domain-containing protein [Candidatus Faecousia sp.]
MKERKLEARRTGRPRRSRRRKPFWPLYALNILLLIFAAAQVTRATRMEEPEPRTEMETLLDSREDIQAPVIQGAVDMTFRVGDTAAYFRGVTVEDDRDGSPRLEVDSTRVDLSAPGVYPLYYTARDASGNETRLEVSVTVLPRETEEDGTIDLAVEEILAGILTRDMTQRQQVEAIYAWAKEHIRYAGHTSRVDYRQAGYETITSGEGDCYGYFAATKLMLEALEIPNVDVCKVKRSDDDSEHFWSLVSVDGGETYYHFDATPRVGQTEELCLVTDLFLDSFDTFHDGCHNRDKSLYPATPEGWA